MFIIVQPFFRSHNWFGLFVCLFVPYRLLTQKQKGVNEPKFSVNVPRCRSNQCANFLVKRSVRVTIGFFSAYLII